MNFPSSKDSRDAFSKVLPKERYIINKQRTNSIECGNSNVRNDSPCFTRLTKVVSKSGKIVNNILKFNKPFAALIFSMIFNLAHWLFFSNNFQRHKYKIKQKP